VLARLVLHACDDGAALVEPDDEMAAVEVAFGVFRDQPLDALEPVGGEVDHHDSLAEQPFGVVRHHDILGPPVKLTALLPDEYRLIRPRAGRQPGLGSDDGEKHGNQEESLTDHEFLP
jgi:hypothetical protein